MLRLIVRRPLAVAAAAATGAAGVATAKTVCDSAALAAKQNSSKPESVKVTPFSLGGEQHDQSTFVGRLTKIQELIDMRTIFLTDADVAAAQARLNEFKRLGRCPDGVSDQDMWEAQRTVNAVVHGPTGEKMFLPGRMSMFVPMNLPITAGMVLAASQQASMRVTLLLQWANQTYNVVNNYVCRAGPEVAYGPLAQSYGLAVTASAFSPSTGGNRSSHFASAAATAMGLVPVVAAWGTQPGQEQGDPTSLQRGCSRSDSREASMARFEFAPRDDRSSKNEPNRVEHDRGRSLAKLDMSHPFPAQARSSSRRRPRPSRTAA